MQCVDRRQSQRVPATESAFITLLSVDEEFARCPAKVVDQSLDGMRVETAISGVPGALVRLDFTDSILLGEITWCAKVGDRYHLGLQMEQSLQRIGDLQRLVASLMGQEHSRVLYQPDSAKALGD